MTREHVRTMVDPQSRVLDVLQAASVVVGIAMGVVPAIRWFASANHGVAFRVIFGTQTGAMAYAIPGLIIVVCLAAIAGLEIVKRRA